MDACLVPCSYCREGRRGGYPGATQGRLPVKSFDTVFYYSNLSSKVFGQFPQAVNAAADGKNAQDGFGLIGLSAMQPLCSVSLKIFAIFFFDLVLLKD